MARGKITSMYHFRVEINKPDEKVVKYFLNFKELEQALNVSRPTLYEHMKKVRTVKKLKGIEITQGKFDRFKQVPRELY